MKDSLDPASHKQLNNNLKEIGLCAPIREMIMDSYRGALVKILPLMG
jgi:hypothetical protein